ncbi:MAG: hypothetical protein LWW93_17095 [Hyphomicrobiales bacterium]|nr:hypothetical protein [Hyphomicrobiales bacterium]
MTGPTTEADTSRSASSSGAPPFGGAENIPSVDPRAAATASIAWLVVINKPIYPLYVWWFVGVGTTVAWATALSAPLFLAIALGAAKWPFLARVALPLVGAVDTMVATALLGQASGTELFFVPCLLLSLVAFSPEEDRPVRLLVAGLFVVFVASHEGLGAGIVPWAAEQASRLLDLNILAVASLSAFIGWSFAGVGSKRPLANAAHSTRSR